MITIMPDGSICFWKNAKPSVMKTKTMAAMSLISLDKQCTVIIYYNT